MIYIYIYIYIYVKKLPFRKYFRLMSLSIHSLFTIKAATK